MRCRTRLWQPHPKGLWNVVAASPRRRIAFYKRVGKARKESGRPGDPLCGKCRRRERGRYRYGALGARACVGNEPDPTRRDADESLAVAVERRVGLHPPLRKARTANKREQRSRQRKAASPAAWLSRTSSEWWAPITSSEILQQPVILSSCFARLTNTCMRETTRENRMDSSPENCGIAMVTTKRHACMHEKDVPTLDRERGEFEAYVVRKQRTDLNLSNQLKL